MNNRKSICPAGWRETGAALPRKSRAVGLGLFFLLLIQLPVSATVFQLIEVFQPVTLIGTDSVARPAGFEEPLAADIVGRPLVLQGALPEALIEAVGAPLQLKVLPESAPYREKEVNLICLCQIEVEGRYVGRRLRVTLDLSRLRVPERLELSAPQVVRLSVAAIEKTLTHYARNSLEPSEVAVTIIGTPVDQPELGRFEKKFRIGG